MNVIQLAEYMDLMMSIRENIKLKFGKITSTHSIAYHLQQVLMIKFFYFMEN